MEPQIKGDTMKRTLVITSIMLALVGSLVSAKATSITYDLTFLPAPGNNRWQYTYRVNNNTLGASITDFIIYFPDVVSSDNFSYTLVGGTGGGEGFVLSQFQPSGIDLCGFAEFSGGNIPVGNTQNSFMESCIYTGSATLGSQYFEVYDPANHNLLDSGWTTPTPPGPWVPEGGTTLAYALLAGLSLLGVGRLQPVWSGRQKS
jgi:hypothetical protein